MQQCSTRFFLAILILFATSLNAQNLVPNPGFEVQDTCPAVSQIQLAHPWNTATLGTPDLYNSTCGTQNLSAHTGHGSSGVFVYSGVFHDNREYMQAALTSPLMAGQGYCVSFWVKRLNYRFASDRIGAHFHTGAVHLTSTGVMPYDPQVENPAGNVLSGSAWTYISGAFVASGGEDQIIIGSFATDAETDTVVANTTSIYHYAYYAIDDVSVTACNVGIDEAVLSSADIIVFPQPASDRITVRCAACSTPATIQLIDGTGATVSTITNVRLGSTCVDMDLDGYAPGLYFLDLRSAGQRVTKRVLVVE